SSLTRYDLPSFVTMPSVTINFGMIAYPLFYSVGVSSVGSSGAGFGVSSVGSSGAGSGSGSGSTTSSPGSSPGVLGCPEDLHDDVIVHCFECRDDRFPNDYCFSLRVLFYICINELTVLVCAVDFDISTCSRAHFVVIEYDLTGFKVLTADSRSFAIHDILESRRITVDVILWKLHSSEQGLKLTGIHHSAVF